MSSREKILAAIKANTPEPVAAPELSFTQQVFTDPVSHFCEMLQAVGGMAKFVPQEGSLLDWCEIKPNSKVLSAIETLEDENIDRAEIKIEHDMKDIDYACFDAEFAVAENGAFLTHGEDFKFRSLYFLAQHLIVRIKKSRILNNMHEAYAELGKMKTGSFTGFISGPSKTADIEQCLVIGAHGARSLQVLIVED
jgi:L-lactate dehydrogenase complex protein LldG